MALLPEEKVGLIVDRLRKTGFKGKPVQVPAFILRFVSFAVALLFFIITIAAAWSSWQMAFMPLTMAVCWLLTALIFQLQWIRYSENYAFKTTLDKLEGKPRESAKEEN